MTVALKRLDLDDVQKIPLKSSGAKRYEKGLRRVGLGAPEGRPIPADLDQALCEVGALRDVWVHRAGRVDLLRSPKRRRFDPGTRKDSSSASPPTTTAHTRPPCAATAKRS